MPDDNVSMKIIDFHTHIFPPDVIANRETYRRRDRWFDLLYANPRARLASASDLVSSMDEAGVDLSVAFGFGFADPGLCRACNTYVLDAAREHGGRLIPFAVVNPCEQHAASLEARRCLEMGASGIGELMPDGQGFELTDFALLDPLMKLARHFNVPILIHVNEQVGHVYPGKGRQGPGQAYLLSMRYPENTLVFAHLGGGLPFYELMPEVRSRLGNVYYDTSASLYLYDDAVFGYATSWAPNRVLFGTDYPLVGQGRFLRRVRRAGLDSDVLDGLLGGNALPLLHRPALHGEEGV
ncbi:MAG: hypothetical protein E3J25_03325 [Anaerolineales bacterium]|nr:MAG: hypothetical protein E3J25_03325 [Anaerolineales bacterium]